MGSKNRSQAIAEKAWNTLRHLGIPGTPRHFEVLFSYCSEDKPRLVQRIDRLIAAAEPFTASVMDSLYQDFFAAPDSLGSMATCSRELQRIAADLMQRVAADQGSINKYSMALQASRALFAASPTLQDTRNALDTLTTATDRTADRIRALEQLFIASIDRISDLDKQLNRAEQDALRDPLTGLANRRAFDAALVRATDQAVADGSEVALLLLDIDHFKHFNDVHGHMMGDKVLRLVAHVLADHIKGRDTAARYGGEEFAIILVGAGFQAAITVGKQICALLETYPLINRSTGQRLGVITCSIGVAVFQPGEGVGALIDRSDRALYKAKLNGRNQVYSEEAGK